ncbi:MAG TPA: hypothetical protein VMR18_03015 [Candidatus Saccharimonadales bacterium]|nr:hypothetical protein [Candidatus Saccharimonadales bacterium]
MSDELKLLDIPSEYNVTVQIRNKVGNKANFGLTVDIPLTISDLSSQLQSTIAELSQWFINLSASEAPTPPPPSDSEEEDAKVSEGDDEDVY